MLNLTSPTPSSFFAGFAFSTPWNFFGLISMKTAVNSTIKNQESALFFMFTDLRGIIKNKAKQKITAPSKPKFNTRFRARLLCINRRDPSHHTKITMTNDEQQSLTMGILFISFAVLSIERVVYIILTKANILDHNILSNSVVTVTRQPKPSISKRYHRRH